MGSLKPGATYIYEHSDGITYAREFGSSPTTRVEIGRTLEKQTLEESLKESKLWGEIHRAAKTNPLLRDALERAIMIYHLGRKDGKE